MEQGVERGRTRDACGVRSTLGASERRGNANKVSHSLAMILFGRERLADGVKSGAGGCYKDRRTESLLGLDAEQKFSYEVNKRNDPTN